MYSATGTARAVETVYREESETSLLDAIVEAGMPARVAPVAIPEIDGLLASVEAPTVSYSRGRRLVVRDVDVARQDSDVLCQGGLFGAVEASATPQGHRAMMQAGLFAGAQPETRRGSVCTVCGDPRCGIGPFGGVA